MSVWLFLAMCAGGGVGAAMRFIVDERFAHESRDIPVGLLVVNASGSFLLGVVVALVSNTMLNEDVAIVLGLGMLGGYTTFSAASLTTVRLIRARRWSAALVAGPGMVALCTAFAASGIAVTSIVVG